MIVKFRIAKKYVISLQCSEFPAYIDLCCLRCSKKLKMSDAIDDMFAYTRLNDSVYLNILNSSDLALKPAQEILKKIESRKLYPFIGQTRRKPNTHEQEVTYSSCYECG